MSSCLDAQTLLRRFCFLGSFECLYQYQSRNTIDVCLYYPQVKKLCEAVDNIAAERLLREALHDARPVRRDEPIFIYACYLESDALPEWKLAMRQSFAALIVADTEMFLFCKYVRLIRSAQKSKGVSAAVRKALSSWYKAKKPAQLRSMCLERRGAHGFTHKGVMHLCHISDADLGAVDIYKSFVKTCSSQLQVNGTAEPKIENGGGDKTVGTPLKKGQPAKEAAKELNPRPSLWEAVCRLRVTQDHTEACELIKEYKLRSSHVPDHWLHQGDVLDLVAPSMSFWELMQLWRYALLQEQDKKCSAFLVCTVQKNIIRRNIIRAADVHPLALLMEFQKLGVRSDYEMLKDGDNMKVPFLRDLYAKCFGKNRSTGLRMHFTINLQDSYKKKLLKHCHKVSYYHAAVALAFGYFKKETNVDVSYWIQEKNQLEEIPWHKDIDISNAIAVCDTIVNAKNSQLLTAPIIRALRRKQIYDVFVVIVPTAGRGNPNNCSDQLCLTLDKYRSTVNSRAK